MLFNESLISIKYMDPGGRIIKKYPCKINVSKYVLYNMASDWLAASGQPLLSHVIKIPVN